MKRKLQFAGWLMALGMGAVLAAPSFAQGPRTNGAQNRQANKPPAQHQRQAQKQERRQQQAAPRAQNERQKSGGNRPPSVKGKRADTTARPNNKSKRPPAGD